MGGFFVVPPKMEKETALKGEISANIFSPSPVEEIAESEKLYTAFNINKMDMWQNNPAKQNRIKRALFDVLGTKSETERIFNIFLAHQPKSAGELQQYLSLNYQVGTHISVFFDEQAKNEIIITDVTVDTVNYQFMVIGRITEDNANLLLAKSQAEQETLKNRVVLNKQRLDKQEQQQTDNAHWSGAYHGVFGHKGA